MLAALLLFAVTAHAATIPNTSISDCTYTFDGLKYKRSAVLTIKGLPTNLVYDTNKSELYFTLIDLETLQDDELQTKMDQYVLKHKEPIKIEGINGQAAAVDEVNKRVYIASDSGLSTINKTYQPEFYGFKDEDIVQLFKPRNRNNLYAVLYPDNEVYKINLDINEKEKVQNIPCAYILAVDFQENIYYECDSKTLKVLLKGFQESIEFVGIHKNAVRAITVDNDNRVIVAVNDGLYHVSPHNIIPEKLMNLEMMPSGITFDHEDIYIATNSVIYKYTRENCSDLTENDIPKTN